MIERIPFGRTGHLSSRAIFGGVAVDGLSQAEADETLELLLRYGVNHIDTAASYGDSEDRIGPWMERQRQDFFLASKTGERTYQKALDEIQRSLERLRTDHLDLIQLHNLIDPDEWQVAMGSGGALEAAIEARQHGLVRFIGVTGHTLDAPRMHLRSLEQYEFDSVLFPYNYPLMQNPQYAADVEALLSICQERNVAPQTIKSMARRHWDGRPKTSAAWYEPLQDPDDVRLGVHFVLGRPGIFMNTVGDPHLLSHVFSAADQFESEPSEEEMRELAERLEMAPLWPEAQTQT